MLYLSRFTLKEIFLKIPTATVYAASFYEINDTHIAKQHTQLDKAPSMIIESNEKNVFHVKEYITEEEALKDPPLTDVMKTVSVARSSVNLKGEYFKTELMDTNLSFTCVTFCLHQENMSMQ